MPRVAARSGSCPTRRGRGAVSDLDQLIRLAQAQQLRLVAEAGARGLPGRQGHARLEHWVRAQTPTTSRRAAAGQARRAERLFSSAVATDLAPTRQAMLAGQVGVEQADVVARTVQALVPPAVPVDAVPAHAVVEAQSFLLAEASRFDPTELGRLADYLVLRLGPDADQRLAGSERAQQQARSLTLATTNSGMVHVEGLLSPACGAAVRTAIDAWSAPQPAADGTPDPRTAAQRRHDGLHQLAAKAIAAPDFLPSTHGSPYRVVVTITQRDLAAGLGAALPDGTRISARRRARCCAAPTSSQSWSTASATRWTSAGPNAPSPPGNAPHWPSATTGAPGPAAAPHRSGPTPTTSSPGSTADHQPRQRRPALQPSSPSRAPARRNGHVSDGQVTWDTGPPGQGPAPTITRTLRLLDDLIPRWRLP